MIPEDVSVFSTCVQSADVPSSDFVARCVEVARWSEAVGCTGMLIYADNRLVDPWLVAQAVLAGTERLHPLIAVQPVYMHPYTVANLVSSLAYMYGRRVYLNMVAGGFRNDLLALNDDTPHDRRYDRLVEYTTIIQDLLRGGVVSFDGEFYTVKNLSLNPAIRPELLPGVFLSGSSTAGLAAARRLNATAVQYPTRPEEFGDVALEQDLEYGIRVGVIARDESSHAWDVAEARFPSERAGVLTRQLADKVSDSSWHHQLMDQVKQGTEERDPYWLVPFENYKTMCPYLVGNHDVVAQLISAYREKGYHTFILDIPGTEEDLSHTAEAFARCSGAAQ